MGYSAINDVTVSTWSKEDAKAAAWLRAATEIVFSTGVKAFDIQTDPESGKVKHSYVELVLTNKTAKALRKALNEAFGPE